MKTIIIKEIYKRFVIFLVPLLGTLIFLLSNAKIAYSALNNTFTFNNNTVIEHLRIQVPETNKEAWLNAEKDSWEKWLITKKGFLGRQLFWDPKREEAVLLIGWSSRADWKDIPQKEINAVQEQFEELARIGTGKESGNPFPILFEGELLPQ